MKNTILYLIGFAGTGKYTIAKEIAALTGAVLVDNHLINNPVFSVIGADGKTPLPAGIWQKTEGIRHIVLDTIAELGKPESSFIFTNQLYAGNPVDRRWYEDVEKLATKRNALFVPVILRCELEELCRRVTSPERALRLKEIVAEKTRKKIRKYTLLRIEHPNYLELDVTNLSPLQAAQTIIAHVEQRTSDPLAE